VFDISASWKQDGDKRTYATEIRIRQDGGASLDNISGKAMRRLLARVYQMATGRYVADADTETDANQPAGLEAATPKFLEAPAAPVMIASSEQKPEPPPASVEPPGAYAPGDEPVSPPPPGPASLKRGPGRPPGSKSAPKPPPPPVEVSTDPKSVPTPPPPSKPPVNPAPPRQVDLTSLGASRIERSQALTLPQFRQVMTDVGLEESDLLGHLRKKHGLPEDVTSLEQLALVRQPLWRWLSENAQTAMDQVHFALGRS
jgi:hypothetical protein